MKKRDYITPMLRVTGIRHAQMVAASEMSGTAAGYRDGTSLYDAGSGGYYWSSSPRSFSSVSAYYMNFNSGYLDWYYYIRYNGCPVRPVTE